MKNIIFLILFTLLLGACTQKEEKVESDVYYTCSMDPQVIESKPGNCPICKMPLTKVKKDHSTHEGGLHLSDQQIQLGNIKTDVLAEHELGDEIQLTGRLTIDQNKQWSISSRVMGRVDKLYIKNTGEPIKEGDVVYEIYSEDLNLAAREYKLALDKKRSLKTESIDIDKIIQSAKNKLKLYGLGDKQIEKLNDTDLSNDLFKITSSVSGIISSVDIKEGDYVMEGGSIYHVADYGNLWAEAQVFIDDLSKVKEGMNATLRFPGLTEKKVESKITFMNPELGSGTQINIVRVEVPNLDNRLKVGMQVDFSILLNTKSVLALPTNAVLLEGKGASVWVKKGHNKFESVMVHTGLETNEYTQILHGLNKGDTIVVSGAYLLNSEYMFKKGANPMEGHDMSKMK
ncbi:MAG: efflux RND transporter periplasmic adaptor subunit [Bacteroidetes bacterium]|nr:efflux RND transporter periplasmic adaptor subunit [Bacteroidota bacterium]